MSKTLVIAGAALLAASVASLAAPTPAEAKKGFHFGGGHHHHHHHHRFHRRHIIVTPVYTETYRVKRAAPVLPKKKVLVSSVDGKGRAYDATSKSWHDGQNRCWSGQQPWVFKAGDWYYGNSRWTQSGDSWLTSAKDAPIAIDCQSVPAFAAKATGSSPKEASGGASGDAAGPAPPVKKVEELKPSAGVAGAGDPAAGGCKKYFPSVGEMIPAPCTN